MTDKIDSQINHCFSNYSGNALKDKLLELCQEWFLKGFSEGIEHSEKLKDES
jgi:hypothetical protein